MFKKILGIAPAREDKPKPPRLDLALLESRILFSASPFPVEVMVAEDAGNSFVDLFESMASDGADPADMELSIIENSNPDLFNMVRFTPDGQLEIDYKENAHGESLLKILLESGDGKTTEELDLRVNVESVNDAPTFLGFQNVEVDYANNRTTIDLYASFEDAEDADEWLTFQVVDNSNEALFESIRIENGLLILDHADGAEGTADIKVVATDRGGLSVGWGTDENFKVYDSILGQVGVHKPDTEAIGLSEITLLTHWAYFDFVNGAYDFTELDEHTFQWVLNNPDFVTADVPVVFNIEHPLYDNSPEGRDRMAEVFHFAANERPDITFGFYNFLPGREYWKPVLKVRAEQDLAMGLVTGDANRLDEYIENYETWQADNALYRTEQVSAEFGGGTVAEKLHTINPSLYAFYDESLVQGKYVPVELDADANTFTSERDPFHDVQTVQLLMGPGGTLRNGLRLYETYHVINATDTSFQLSETAGGPAIDFSSRFSGNFFVQAREFTDHMAFNRTILDFRTFAEENIKESRLYGKEVHPWISPSIRGEGEQMLSQDYFRLQLDILRPLADSVIIFELHEHTAEFHENQGWWRALEDFMGTFDDPAATITLDVSASEPNDAPTAGNDSITTVEDRVFRFDNNTLLNNDADANGDALSIQVVDGPTHGSLYVTNGQWNYLADSDYNGPDSFTYRVSDGQATSNLATVSILVQASNDAPVGEDDVRSTAEDTPLTITTASLMQNDYDIDGDALSFSIVNQPVNGQLTVNPDGTLEYIPDAEFSGADEFYYQVSDGEAVSAATRVDISVTAVNDSPIAAEDSFSVGVNERIVIRDRQLLINDSDVDSTNLEVDIVAQPANGTLQAVNGGFQYTPDEGFSGVDHFIYRATDGSSHSLPVSVEINVIPVSEQDVHYPVARPEIIAPPAPDDRTVPIEAIIAGDVKSFDPNFFQTGTQENSFASTTNPVSSTEDSNTDSSDDDDDDETNEVLSDIVEIIENGLTSRDSTWALNIDPD